MPTEVTNTRSAGGGGGARARVVDGAESWLCPGRSRGGVREQMYKTASHPLVEGPTPCAPSMSRSHALTARTGAPGLVIVTGLQTSGLGPRTRATAPLAVAARTADLRTGMELGVWAGAGCSPTPGAQPGGRVPVPETDVMCGPVHERAHPFKAEVSHRAPSPGSPVEGANRTRGLLSNQDPVTPSACPMLRNQPTEVPSA
jgi:hypothetical protein